MELNKYYNGASVLNANCPINFSSGTRSSGKSFYWKRYCVSRFLEHGEQFIYIRRTDEDIKNATSSFFDDISVKFPGKGMTYASRKFYIGDLVDGELQDAQICGYAFPLSSLHKIKSVVLSKVNTILFDEFLPEDNRYLHPADPSFEPMQLMSLYMTVARGVGRPIREEVKIICISNMVTKYSPYYTYFGIDLTKKQKGVFNNVYAECVINNDTNAEILNSKFGQILEGTSYGDYALSNDALFDDEYHIINKIPREARPWICLRIRDKWYMGLYSPDGLFFDERYDKTLRLKYSFAPSGLDKEELSAIPMFCGEVQKICRKYAEQDRVYYRTGRAKQAISGLILPPNMKGVK